jgi:hypothetical protein
MDQIRQAAAELRRRLEERRYCVCFPRVPLHSPSLMWVARCALFFTSHLPCSALARPLQPRLKPIDPTTITLPLLFLRALCRASSLHTLEPMQLIALRRRPPAECWPPTPRVRIARSAATCLLTGHGAATTKWIILLRALCKDIVICREQVLAADYAKADEPGPRALPHASGGQAAADVLRSRHGRFAELRRAARGCPLLQLNNEALVD